MTYHMNVFKLLFSMEDHLYRIKKAEQVRGIWKISGYLLLGSIIIYVWMALLGMGSDFISEGATSLSSAEYEQAKFWFAVGRAGYSILVTAFVLFIPALLYRLLIDIPFYKLMMMQQVVLFVLLVERLLWIPLARFFGLEWFVSPFSLGIITSYITDVSWWIYFFGAVSLFQVWVIWFQVRFMKGMTSVSGRLVWLYVIILHIIGWCLVASLHIINSHYVSGWIG